MDAPLPTLTPPHEEVYHCQEAPAPKLPPLTDNVVDWPLQIVDVPVMEVGATDNCNTVTPAEAQDVVLQVPSALTK